MGRSLLHFLALSNDIPNLIKILKLITKTNNHHILLLEDYENHWNILHFAIFSFNFTFGKIILNFNTPVLSKLLKHKDKNGLTPFDLLQTFNTTIENSNKYLRISIDSTGNYVSKSSLLSDHSSTKSSLSPSPSPSPSSLIISLPSGDFSELNLSDNLFPPPSINPLITCNILKFESCLTHSALITSSGHLYLSNPQPTLFHSSFCRIKFFDDLYEKGEKVIDISLTSGHTVVLTSSNRAYAFGNNIKRINLYPMSQASSSSSSSSSLSFPSSLSPSISSTSSYSKEFSSLIPISISLKSRTTSISSNSQAHNNPMSNKNFSALFSLNSLNNETSISSISHSITGVTSSNNHTIIYSKSSLHIHGLNLGQFGPLSNDTSNKSVSSNSNASYYHINWKYDDDPISQVLALDLATLVVTKSSLIHIYIAGFHVKLSLPFDKDLKDSWNKFKPRILSMPKQIIKLIPPVSSGNNSSISSNAGNLHSNYSILMLLDSGEVYVFTFPKYSTSKDTFKDSVKFTLIWNPSRAEMRAKDASIPTLENNNNSGIGAVLCTASGEVFKRSKSKWTRINDVSKIKNVSIGYGFPIIGSYTADDNQFKTILLRQETIQLKHQLDQPNILLDFAKLSPLYDILNDKSTSNLKGITSDIDFLMDNIVENHDTILDDHILNNSTDKQNEIVFAGHINPLPFSSDNITNFPYFHSESFFSAVFSSKDTLEEYTPTLIERFNKFYDYPIKVINTSSNTEVIYNVHKNFVFNRLGINSPTFVKKRKDLIFRFNETDGIIVGEIDVRSVALFLHMLYTDQIMDLSKQNDESTTPVKTGLNRLLYTLPMENLLKTIKSTFNCEIEVEDDLSFDDGDVTIKLSDGDLKTWKYLLVSRCDYFKQYFAEYWTQSDIVDFSHISKYTWKLVVNYLCGYYNDGLFLDVIKELVNTSNSKIEEKKIIKKKQHKILGNTTEDLNRLESSDDFVNVVLDVLYFSNELLLPKLRQLCELAIKDCINFNNYDIILQHAFISGSTQLFANCCWFIFTNLYLCYHDQRLNSNVIGEDCAYALDIKIRELINIYIPDRKNIDINEKGKKKKKSKVKEVAHNTDIFMNDFDEFNEYYLHHYLWDEHGISEEQISNTLSNRRKSQSQNANLSNISKSLRSNSNSNFTPEILNAGLDTRSSSNESAISDDTDADQSDGFIVVQKGNRRKSSSANILSSTTTGTNRSYSSTLLNKPLVRRDSGANIISSSKSNEPWKIIRKLSTSSTSTADIPISNTSIQPIVGSSNNNVVTNNSLDEILTQSKINTKQELKIKSKIKAPIRMSQKERKLKEQREREAASLETTSSKASEHKNDEKSPWNKTMSTWGMNAPKVVESSSDTNTTTPNMANSILYPEINAATMLAPNKLHAAHFPSLEELRSAKNKNTTNSWGSNSINSSTTTLPNPIIPTTLELPKSLEEIRAEEEFEKWWKEESERVQRSMNQNVEDTNTKNSNHQSNGRGNKNGARGSGRGNRGSNRGRGRKSSRGNHRGGPKNTPISHSDNNS